jgi:hypothetical protein
VAIHHDSRLVCCQVVLAGRNLARRRKSDVALPRLCRNVRNTGLKEVFDARYRSMPSEELVRCTTTHLKNLGILPTHQEFGPDGELRILLIPELCDRLVPGTRTALRRITCTLAEYDPGTRNLFRLSEETRARLLETAVAMRVAIDVARRQDVRALVERVRFATSGSKACERWLPTDHVYEPAFVYRLVPAIVRAVILASENTNEQPSVQ